MRQIDAAHQNDAATIATLPVSDAQGRILCDDQGVSLALHALYYGHRALAEQIIQRCTVLDVFTAAALDQHEVLLQHINADPHCVNACAGDGFHPLGLACFFAATHTAKLCIDCGANVNHASQNAFKVAPIHSATAADSIEIVRALITAGADVNQAQQDGFCALHNAAQHGNIAICELLLAAGADTHARTNDGKTALDMAVAHNHHAVYELLSRPSLS